MLLKKKKKKKKQKQKQKQINIDMTQTTNICVSYDVMSEPEITCYVNDEK